MCVRGWGSGKNTRTSQLETQEQMLYLRSQMLRGPVPQRRRPRRSRLRHPASRNPGIREHCLLSTPLHVHPGCTKKVSQILSEFCQNLQNFSQNFQNLGSRHRHPTFICNFPKFRQNSVKFSKKNSENSTKVCKIAKIRKHFGENEKNL